MRLNPWAVRALSCKVDLVIILLQLKSSIKLIVNDAENRLVSVTADHKEFRNIKEVEIMSSKDLSFELLFDNNHSMDERILKEQFYS